MQNILSRLKTNYLYMTALSSISTVILYQVWKNKDAVTFVADVTGYISIFLLVLSLLIGSINLILKRKNPISTYLRRDIGIYGGSLAIIHSVTGLFVHLRGKMWQYFLNEIDHKLDIRTDNFGMANYTGVIAALLIIVLLAISNNYSLSRLKAAKWKNLQRLSYFMFIFVLIHAILYSILLNHISLVFYLYIPIVLMVLIFQVIGIKLRLQRRTKFI
jgi:sulfoxide reductase heme-binding subunit YedZ